MGFKGKTRPGFSRGGFSRDRGLCRCRSLPRLRWRETSARLWRVWSELRPIWLGTRCPILSDPSRPWHFQNAWPPTLRFFQPQPDTLSMRRRSSPWQIPLCGTEHNKLGLFLIVPTKQRSCHSSRNGIQHSDYSRRQTPDGFHRASRHFPFAWFTRLSMVSYGLRPGPIVDRTRHGG